ncbi:hypothetical protein [Nonomuraea endophytica]|uniref:hypothetical protein n=1 Tax=Nonomuraea endophytica TaxID=714136 RepID=UPI0037CA1A8F
MRLRLTTAAALAAASMAAGLMASAATPAQASPVARSAIAAHAALNPAHATCGWVTCSLYFSRSMARWIATDYGEAMGYVGDYCPANACKIAALGGEVLKWKATEAAGKNQCLRIRYGRLTWHVVGLYSDGSKHCHNS